jgi:Tol biopolymer transport system component
MIAPGTRIGSYEITAFLGAGGMGEVYRARDVRLNRTVALKILPSSVAADPAFRARFEREARVISGLDHSHICALYDVGSDQGTDFLVMQFLDGETLAARVERGPLSQQDALRYGSEIADALAAAHREGIVHRDLKPANVMLTKAGVKLLDFGVAKLTQSGPSSLGTRTSPLTGQGVLLGTLQYMAPEQLEGRDADARSDIWALGTVLYEMLTGRAPFSGRSQASVIGAILHSVPEPVSASQAVTPPVVDRIVAKCLAKDPDERWQSAHDLADELRWIAKGTTAPTGSLKEVSGRPRRWMTLALAGAAIVALASVGLAAWAWLRARPAAVTAYRLSVALPDAAQLESGIALSPNARWLAFVGPQESQQVAVLWIRDMNSFDARPIPGTEGAELPFWSPDSRHVGFFAGGKLRRVSVDGGAPQVLADGSSAARGGTWSRDNVIVFAPGFATGLSRVPADGGEVRPLTTLKPPDSSHRWPHFLPDGRHYLYLVRGALTAGAQWAVFLGSLDGGEPTKLLTADSSVAYVPPGYLLFAQSGVLLAQRFNASERTLSGDPFVVSDKILRVGESGPTGLAVFSATDRLLVYSANESAMNEVGWYDRSGRRLSTHGAPSDYAELSLSPDQSQVVVASLGDLWILNFARGTSTRFTFDAGSENSPLWSPDGKSIVYTATPFAALTSRAATGGITQQLLQTPGEQVFPDDWSRDGRHILFERVGQPTQSDLWALPLTAARADGTLVPSAKPFPVITSPFNEAQAQFSPDGKWITYGSDESGRSEVYVQSFPPGQGKWLVSTDGGGQPAWRRDGRELFYISADKRVVAVDVRTTPTFQIGASTTLFRTTMAMRGLADVRNTYVASADGQRFLLSSVPSLSHSTTLRVMLNWSDRQR